MATTREQFAHHVRRLDPIDRLFLVDSLDIAIGGGCPACDTEREHMCVACGSCRCDTHEHCTRPPTDEIRNEDLALTLDR
jgi:hypothetical protein